MVETGDDQELIGRCRRGDQEAFTIMVGRYQRMVYSVAYRMTYSAEDADDLAQEIFLKAWREIGTLQAQAKFSAWLYRLSVNACLNWRKSAGRRGRLHEKYRVESEVNPHTEALGETAEKIHAALQQLDARQRAAIVLTVYEGLSHAEAARALGCAETTISWRIFAARRRLKQLLRDLPH